jgi:Cytochrome oxidase complex assembly protein 1
MTTPPSATFAVRPPPPPRPQTWFERNWKWLVPLLVVVVLFAFSAFIGGGIYFVESALRSSYPYQVAVKRATESPVVAAKLGTPLHVGWFVSGSLGFNGSEGSASLGIPISGPNGKGSIKVVGKKHANHWNVETLELDVSGQDEPIQLLEPALDTSPASTGDST